MTFWVAGAAVAGAVISSNAAGDAADKQAQSATDASNKQIALNQPFRDMGLSAGNRLMTLLGLQSGTPETRDSMRTRLLSQYTSGGTPGTAGGSDGFSGATQNGLTQVASTPGTIDEAGLNAEIDKQMAAQASQGSGDPAYGSLMKDFTPADFQAGVDPGYQFRQDQGQQALDRSAAGRGGLLSGRAAKDMASYSQGLASQEYQNAFNRFQTNRTNKLNPLQSLLGVGQTTSNALGTQLGNNITGAGNAQAAAGIVGGNAMQNALNQGASAYKNGPTGTTTATTYAGFGNSPMSNLFYSNGSLGD